MGELGEGTVAKGRRFVVCGRVQGVGFRSFARDVALRLGVSGWAQNLPDGSVLVEAIAPPMVLDAFAMQLRQGPRFSRVVTVRVEDRTSTDPLPHPFRIQL